MARIRTVKPEFWSDEKLGPLSPLTRLVFLGLVSQADDAGRLLDSARMLNGVLFPYTDDDCAESLDELEAVGVIRRGTTASGQPVIQVCGWSKHQRIEKPNLKAAMGEVAEASATHRRKVGDKVRAAIIERAGGRCEECGVEVKVQKDDRYDNTPNLAEIDHVLPVVDGGSDAPENLRLLCLSCNRRKAGRDLSARNLRRVADESGKDRRPDLRSTTDDQRPTTNDRRAVGDDATAAARERFVSQVPEAYQGAVRAAFRAAHHPTALLQELEAIVTGMHPPAHDHATIGRALHEMAIAGSPARPAVLRAFCRRLAQAVPVSDKSDTELFADA